MSVHVRFQQYGPGEGARVELDDDMGTTIYVCFDGEGDERPTDRTLAPSEARELAAVLVHFATEAERRRPA